MALLHKLNLIRTFPFLHGFTGYGWTEGAPARSLSTPMRMTSCRSPRKTSTERTNGTVRASKGRHSSSFFPHVLLEEMDANIPREDAKEGLLYSYFSCTV